MTAVAEVSSIEGPAREFDRVRVTFPGAGAEVIGTAIKRDGCSGLWIYVPGVNGWLAVYEDFIYGREVEILSRHQIEEPTGKWAIVKDAYGKHWREMLGGAWLCLESGHVKTFSGVIAVEVVFPGVEVAA